MVEPIQLASRIEHGANLSPIAVPHDSAAMGPKRNAEAAVGELGHRDDVLCEPWDVADSRDRELGGAQGPLATHLQHRARVCPD